MMSNRSIIHVENLSIGYEDKIIMQNLSFQIAKGDIFIIMGGSGCGKSTLLRTLTGLIPAKSGQIWIQGTHFLQASPAEKLEIMKHSGILYQGGALFSSMTLAENVALPLQQYTDYSPDKIQQIVAFKLAVVGLAGYENYYPSEISGGMRKRAGLARALALDPEIVYFDEPSAGLDPVSSKNLDDLIKFSYTNIKHKIAGKIEGKLKNTLGVFISMSGFSNSALDSNAHINKSMILIDGQDIMMVLEDRISLSYMIRLKRRHASETGEIMFRIQIG